MKTLAIVLIASIALVQFDVSLPAASQNSAARDLAAAKSFAFGGVGVAGLMSEGERNLRAVLQQSDASQQLQAALAHATPAGEPTFWLACVVVILPCIRRSLIPWRVPTMRSKSRVDA